MIRRVLEVLGRHRLLTVAGVVVLAGGVIAGVRLAGDDLVAIVTPEQGGTLPVAAALEAGDGATLFRIDPTGSEVRYEVREVLAGSTNTVTGRTRYVAGELALDRTSPADSELGEVVIDVSRLRSDNRLRDHRLRTSFLESDHFPLARLEDASLEGLPEALEDGREYRFSIDASLVVHDEPHDTTWEATATLDGDVLSAEATTTVLMSDLGVGPINLAGFVRTEDEVRLTISLTARAGGYRPPERLTADGTAVVAQSAESADTPAFSSVIAPLLSRHCAGCHQPGEAGAEIWRLETAGDASRVADGLGLVVQTGYMPPWPASDVGVPLMHSRRLDDETRSLIAAWAEAGGPLDVAPDTAVAPPEEPEVAAPRKDVVLRSDEPYFGDGKLTDDYRCFVLDPGFTEETWVTGVGFEPDQRAVVHHSLIFRLPGRYLERAKARAAEDGRPGYTCFGGAGMGSLTGDGLVGGWVPGQRPQRMEDGDALKFQPGDFIVSQVHYHFAHEDPGDRSTVYLEVDEDGLGEDGSPLVNLDVRQLIAPVEIPCPEGRTGPLCSREAALARALEDYGPAGPGIANGTHALCGTKPEEVASMARNGLGRSVCNHQVRTTGEIVDVLGHMHELGTTFRMTLHPDTPQEVVLLDIPHWDFDWQLNYQPVKPVPVKQGDVIRIECTWDVSLRVDPEPRYLVFSEGTKDEMCFSTVTTRPKP